MTPRETELTQQVELLRRENTLLRQKIDLLVKRVFGSSSEPLDRNQLELLAAPSENASHVTLVVAAPEKDRSKSSRPPREPRLPENLPVVEEVIDPEPVKAKPEVWRCIGQEVSEQLDYEPGRFLKRRVVRRKYVHRTNPDCAPVIAPLPERLLDRSLPAPGLLAQIVVGKYCDHLPLYRQEQIYQQRHGINLPRQSLARWVELAADWFKPIYDHIRIGVMGGGYVQVDETPVDYLEPGNGKTKQGYLWTCSRPGGEVFYRWETSRAAECLENIIPVDFKGTVQCDGYSAYRSFANKRNGTIALAGCWAHLRRKFHEALEQSPKTAGWIMRQIQHLYRVESRLREQRVGPRLREAVRAHESRPIVQRLHRALLRLKTSGRHLPQSLLGIAIDYALGQWKTLEVYVADGRVEIDNNLVENAIRPTAIGKKNWLFIGEAGAGDRGAILYTIIECCRRRNIDPYTYLRDVLTRLPRMTNHQIHEVTPQAWAKVQTQLQRQAAS
ncbi:MAG TPA: IS66 family transposase [Candidatus Saccharimonadales bacterium]|jgi:transposase|nr:IS66 family transposase [Candidatus Saccharimonadales bacterium]